MEKIIQITKAPQSEYSRTHCHYHRFDKATGKYVSVFCSSDPRGGTWINMISDINGLSDPRPCTKSEYYSAFNKTLSSLSGPRLTDSMIYDNITATKFQVKVIKGGVTIGFTATCVDPKNGINNQFDIDIEHVTTHTGEDLLPFLKGMKLDEFLIFELYDYCYDEIYVDIQAVEREERAHLNEGMELIRQSYMG